MLIRFLAVLVCLSFTVLPARAADLDVMIGQMLMAGFRGCEVEADSPIMQDIRERHLGGVILFDRDMTSLFRQERNIRTPDQVRQLIGTLQGAASIPLLVAVDQEGGRVQRLKAKYGFKETPSAQDLGKGPDSAILKAGKTVGRTLADVGFNLDFAPVADVNVNPDSPAIGAIDRSFSSDPERVAQCDGLFLDGLADQGVVGVLKHFPGHGSAGSDSHKGVTDVTDTWSEGELAPYARLIGEGKAHMIMTAHIFNARLDPRYPATLSRRVITGLLRDKLGFKGVVVTDDMDMRAVTDAYGRDTAIRLAIEAGADILLFGNNLSYDPDVVARAHSVIKRLVENGDISLDRIRVSYGRIMRLKRTMGLEG